MPHSTLLAMSTSLALLAGAPALAQIGPNLPPAAPAQAQASPSPAPSGTRFAGGQVSVPAGVTLIVRKITVGPDATLLNTVISYDGDSPFVTLADGPSFIDLGNGQQLFLRAIADNRGLRIVRGETLEGDLVFPGAIPPGTDSVTLVFNQGNDGSDTSSPGIRLPLPLRPAP